MPATHRGNPPLSNPTDCTVTTARSRGQSNHDPWRKINFVISSSQPVVTAVNRGTPLILEQPKHPFVQQILYIGDQLIKQLEAKPEVPAPAAG